MTDSDKRKLIATNAAIWAGGMMLSFVLPMVAESIADGPARFLKMMMHVFPLIVAMVLSSVLISKAIGEPKE